MILLQDTALNLADNKVLLTTDLRPKLAVSKPFGATSGSELGLATCKVGQCFSHGWG